MNRAEVRALVASLVIVAVAVLASGPGARAADAPAPAAEPEMVPGQDWRGRPIVGEEKEWMLRSDRRFPAETTEKVVREAAAELSSLELSSVLWDRQVFMLPADLPRDQYNKMLAQVLDPRHDVGVLERLSRDDDARVSVLALVSLFGRDDPHLLPIIAERLSDERATIPRIDEFSGSPAYGGKAVTKTKPQTVADMARAMIRFYLERSGSHRGGTLQESFQQYWSERGDRDECIGWLRVRMERAKGGSVSARPENREAIMLLYERIKRLPDVYRELAMISILNDSDIFRVTGPSFWNTHGLEQDLVYAARRLYTSGRLLPLMEGKETIDDPDWHPVNLSLFVMKHATEVLDPADADELLAWRERLIRDSRGNEILWDWLTVGAARLRPADAAELLLPLLERGELKDAGSWNVDTALELWQLCGSRETDRLLDWFYQDQPGGRVFRPRRRLVQFLTQRFGVDDRRWLARMVLDERFGDLDWGTLKELAYGLNRNLTVPVVTQAQFEQPHFPLIDDALYADLKWAREKYPDETEQVLGLLEGWRDNIRASLSCWASGETAAPQSDD